MTAAGRRDVDVTVVVAVYNTMPYLTRCLESVVRQTIGLDRLELIAVDDGSTDGSGRELDRFARLHPGAVRVIHQENSGGPAQPSNRALDLATGRYVFFLGADDHLGLDALRRLVDAADEYGSDVTLGRLVGVNGRYVHQAIFAENAVDVGIVDSPLPWSMSNTKLFRRELITRHGLRFPESMRMLSDQPFTIEACVRAKRISVLSDYEFYYAVRRLDASNITFRSRHDDLLNCTTILMDFVANLVGPGRRHDALSVRHFSWELAKLFRKDFLRLDREAQERIRQGVAGLVERYLTDRVSRQLSAYRRMLFRLCQHGTVDDLAELIRYDTERDDPPVVVDGDRWYAAYPGFRDPARGWPDAWFDITDVAVNWLAKLEATAVTWGRNTAGRRSVTVTARSAVPELTRHCTEPVVLRAGEVLGTPLEPPAGGGDVTVRVRFDLDELVAAGPEGALHSVRAHVKAFGTEGAAPVRAHRLETANRLVHRRGTRVYVVNVTKNHNGRLVIAITPVTLRRVVNRLRRGRPQGGKAK